LFFLSSALILRNTSMPPTFGRFNSNKITLG
jgi:hypothetical protein